MEGNGDNRLTDFKRVIFISFLCWINDRTSCINSPRSEGHSYFIVRSAWRLSPIAVEQCHQLRHSGSDH